MANDSRNLLLSHPPSVPSVGADDDDIEEDDLLTADEYWREYLNEMARKKVIEKLVMMGNS